MLTTTTTFNPEMLILAREALGLSQTELSQRVGASQSKISKIEDGSVLPSDGDLNSFVTHLEQPREFFYRPRRLISSAVSFYRKTNSLSISDVKRCNARMNVCRFEVEDKIGESSKGQSLLPYLPPSETGSPAASAKKLRSHWNLPRGKVGNLTELAEKSGCVVVHFDFGTRKLDGLSLWSEGELPFIFLNRDFPYARMRLTLAHEIGHLVMHRTPHDRVEDEAWEFASELLMPAVDISRRFFPANVESLASLKLEWGVSMQALLRRAENLQKISPRYARYLWMQMGKLGYRTNEPFDADLPLERTALEGIMSTN